VTYDDGGWYFNDAEEDDLEVPDDDAERAADAARHFPIGEPD
jgi:ferredoxin